ncbi:E3 ubiquitin-protein ligase RNFT1 isoform X1 [Paramormyrops kingsleyae]|uniref:E3 ubiquitin-protein ligase RNFT1 n=2 Tax=Paramormyrops kingsleyae TaxID=1676925 RepID=A0A3B3Q8K4_9TELE|nr:E3 ubiquitin-protein ligase RNFT1 isoform X1 [Paramormyrops kingsleyae]XP_023688795.1 E3 ubiquitin-protein ligase RNFT1 isoform X1 [Paramormyrops kingsleyae]
MKLRTHHDRSYSAEYRILLKPKESPSVMQTNPNQLHPQAGTSLSLTLQPELLTRTPAVGAAGEEVRVSICSSSGEASGRPASRRQRAGTHGHTHSHEHPHSHSEPESDPGDADLEAGEPSMSFSELRYLFRWLQKSLPFIVILCAKLITQHALGLAVGAGLFTTFLYANKSIQKEVFMQGRRSKLHCLWLLLFMMSSTLLLYYTFHTEALYYSLILVNPTVEFLGFWEMLWTVGVTNFILKFIFMGVKCLILLLPVPLVASKSKGRWYMLLEEIGQVYQTIAPMPLWFRYLVTYQEADGSPALTLGILLALVYLILKLLGLYGHWGSFQKTIRIFLSSQNNGLAATKSQCFEAGDICPICKAAFREPQALPCQHIFCDECIALWLNRERTCPLCRTVIADKVHKWQDGATSPHLQVY